MVILATGGTIAGAAASEDAVRVQSGTITIDAMLAAVPGFRVRHREGRADLERRIAGHELPDPAHGRQAHQRAPRKSADVDGIVITHGTDTMEDSAFFLNLTVKTDKPVVMVGSMRPSTAVSADGPLNLYNAVGVAVDPNARGRGVLVVMNDSIHAAHSLTKTSTTSVETFLSPVRGVVGIASYGKNDFYFKPEWKHTTQTNSTSRR